MIVVQSLSTVWPTCLWYQFSSKEIIILGNHVDCSSGNESAGMAHHHRPGHYKAHKFAGSFVSISQSLPTTSYIKMIEIWMIFTMIFPFIEVALHTCKEGIKINLQGVNVKQVVPGNSITAIASEKKWNKEPSKRFLCKKLNLLNFISDWILPISSMIFITIFWTLGLIENFFPSGVSSEC